MHEMSKQKFRQICLLALMLLYVDSLNVSGLNLNLPEGRYAVNIWSKADIETVLAADLQNERDSYGKLELKLEFGVNYSIFGGADGFTKWFDTHSDPTCPIEQKAQVANLMGSFVSGIAGLLGSLVQGWTSMQGDGAALMANQFGSVAQGFVTGLSKSSAPAERVTIARPSRTKGVYATRSKAANTNSVIPEDNTFLDDVSDTYSSSDGDSSSDDDVDQYAIEPRKGKQVKGGRSIVGDDPPMFRSPPEATATLTPVAVSGGVALVAASQGVGMLQTDLPSAESDTHFCGETTVLEFNAPSYSSPPAHISDATEDNFAASDNPLVDDTTLQAKSHVAQLVVHEANKTSKGKKKLQTLRVKDREIRCVVAQVLGITAEMAMKEVHDDKVTKATPKRKRFPKVLQPTRFSPHLAKQRVSAGASKMGTRPPVIDLDSVRVDVDKGDASDSPGGEVDKGAAENPSFAPADARPPSPPRSESRAAVDVSIGSTAAPPVSITCAPSLAPAPAVILTCRRMKATLSDAVITTTERVVTNVEPRRVDFQGNELVSASTLFSPIPQPVCHNVQQQAEPANIGDNIQGVEQVTNVPVPSGLVAGKSPLRDTELVSATTLFPPIPQPAANSPLLDMEPPMWNFTSQSPVCSEGPSVDNEEVVAGPSVPMHGTTSFNVAAGPSVPVQGTTIFIVRLSHATVVTDPIMDDIPEAIPIPKDTQVGGIGVTTSHAPGDFLLISKATCLYLYHGQWLLLLFSLCARFMQIPLHRQLSQMHL